MLKLVRSVQVDQVVEVAAPRVRDYMSLMVWPCAVVVEQWVSQRRTRHLDLAALLVDLQAQLTMHQEKSA
jgi:hypothetical protein